jgi:hypothetical protein
MDKLDSAPTLPLHQDAPAPISVRVEKLLARMTLDEKIGQMTQVMKLRPSDRRESVTSLSTWPKSDEHFCS